MTDTAAITNNAGFQLKAHTQPESDHRAPKLRNQTSGPARNAVHSIKVALHFGAPTMYGPQ